MSSNSRIEWTDHTWNPVTGCTSISPGCMNCYARRKAYRLRGRFGYPADEPFRVTIHWDKLDEPWHRRKPARVFVCSMGDLFHENVPEEFIDHVFAIMAITPKHVFIVLTKRPERALMWFTRTPSGATREQLVYDSARNNYFPWIWPGWPLPNVWFGVSVENQEMANKRIPVLLQIPAAIRFVSVEPMLGPVDLTNVRVDAYTRINVLEGCGVTTRGIVGQSIPNSLCNKINWVICGGETGPGARPMHPEWVRSLRNQCIAANISFFFKQWGEWVLKGTVCAKTTDFGVLTPAGNWFRRATGWNGRPIDPDTGEAYVVRVGRHNAGAFLDGQEWRQFPK